MLCFWCKTLFSPREKCPSCGTYVSFKEDFEKSSNRTQTVEEYFSQGLPNIPYKPLTLEEIDYFIGAPLPHAWLTGYLRAHPEFIESPFEGSAFYKRRYTRIKKEEIS